MRLLSHTITLSALFAAAVVSPLVKRAPLPQGIDVSNLQKNITWTDVASKGVVWAYIKATEGTCTHLKQGYLQLHRYESTNRLTLL